MDPLEDRVRRALADDRWRLQADTQDVLIRVHRGARRRRRRRTALEATAVVAVLAAGAGGVGLLTTDQVDKAKVASENKTSGVTQTLTRPEVGPDTTTPSPVRPRVEPGPEDGDTTPPSPSTKTPRTRSSPRSQPVPAGFRPVSMTAASEQTFWVLGGDGTAESTAVVAMTQDSGRSFALVGRLDAVAARGDDERSTDTVGEIRFVDTSNGWAYGDGLWATHDGGASWRRIDTLPGRVERLETAAGRAYAMVDDGSGSKSLWFTPAEKDAWGRVEVQLTDPDGLAAARGLVAVTDRSGDKTYAVVSVDEGRTFAQYETPCSADLEGGELSATRDSLWLTCATGTAASVQVSTDHGRTWTAVSSDTGIANSAPVGARGPDSAVAAAPSEVLLLDREGRNRRASVPGLDSPRYTGFTAPDVGYVLDLDGDLFRTDDGGSNWRKIGFG